MVAGRPLTILHVFSTFAVGGPQARFIALADRLGPDYRHLVVSMSGRTDAAARLSPEVDFALVPLLPGSTDPISSMFRFARELRRIRPDLLVTYNWGALEWALGNEIGPGIPHLHIEDGFGPDEAVRRLKRRVWLRRIALMKTKAVVMPSRNLERIALEEWKLPRSRLLYLPNGIDIDRFARSVPDAELAFTKTPGELVVGTCAALRPEKNLQRLIRVVAACGVPNVRLVIAGEGAEHPALEQAARDSGIGRQVTFTGYLTQTETALAGFDVFGMSSDTEQMPLGLLEAMAAGLPAIATDVGDTKDLVADANRPFIVPAADEAAAAAALARLLGDPALRASVGAANRAKARAAFSLDSMVAAYDRLFRETAAR